MLTLIIVEMLAFSAALFLNEYKSIQNTLAEECFDLSEKIDITLKDYITQINGTISSIFYSVSQDPENSMSKFLLTNQELGISDQIEMTRAMNSFFSRLYLMRNDFVDTYINVNLKRDYVFSPFGGKKLEYSPESENWYQQTLALDGSTYVQINYKPEHLKYNHNVIGFSRIIKNVDNEGFTDNTIIRIEFSMNEIQSIFNRYMTNDMTTILLVDADGKIVYQYGVEIDTDTIPVETIGQQSGVEQLGNRQYILSVNSRDVNNWHVVVATDIALAINRVKGFLIFELAISVFLLLCGAVASYLLITGICKPIRVLETGMQEVEKGNFDVSLKHSSDDELGNLIFVFNRMAAQINRLITDKYEAELQRRDAEYRFLQAQINPHFIFNTLQVIESMAIVCQVPQIETMSYNLAKLIRYSISGDSRVISVKEELSSVNSYLEIQKSRYGDRLEYEIKSDIGAENWYAVKMVLQPIVENCILHGFDENSRPGKIMLTCTQDAQNIYIHISDNGIGMSQEQTQALLQKINEKTQVSSTAGQKGHHIGLQNINQRLKMYYGEAYGLQIDSKQNEGTTVTVTLKKERICHGETVNCG